MNSALSPTATFNLHVLLERTEAGRIVASVAELANVQVEADTRKEALEAIQDLVSDRLSQVEVLPLEVSLKETERENPWIEFIGMFEDDTEFVEMAAEWQVEPENDSV